jgi:hypothetical protein
MSSLATDSTVLIGRLFYSNVPNREAQQDGYNREAS